MVNLTEMLRICCNKAFQGFRLLAKLAKLSESLYFAHLESPLDELRYQIVLHQGIKYDSQVKLLT